MTVNKSTTLAKVFMKIDDLPWEYVLYIPASNPNWLPDMSVMVLNAEETDDPDDDPAGARDNGLRYALTISSVQDVVNNARAQNVVPDVHELIRALKFYYDNDAFITLNINNGIDAPSR